MIKIAVDAMGADLGVNIVVEAIEKFLSTHKDVELYVFGQQEQLQKLVGKVEIIDCEDVIKMDEGALSVMRKKESSMYKAIDFVANGGADGVISAGSTGGFVSCTTLKIGLIEGVERVGLTVPFPSFTDNPLLVLDIGANTENTSEHLVRFAQIGRVYYQVMYNKLIPNIYLLSNGAEENKGSLVVKDAHKKLKEMKIEGFLGNIEGREALSGNCDVLVCGGYDGNIFLKTLEGGSKLFKAKLKAGFKGSIFSMLGYFLAKRQLNLQFKKLDYRRYGGALVLGIKSVAVKSHGSSDALAFGFGLEVTYQMIKSQVVDKIKKGLEK